MKDKLMKLLKAKQEARAAKMKLVDDAKEVEELRGLQKEVEALDAEIRDIQAMIDELPDDKPAERTAAVNGEVPGVVVSNAQGQEQRKEVDAEGMEYRKAFMEYVTKGTEIPKELRADAVTATTDVTHAIPSVLVNRIVEKLESIGMILPLVTKTAFPAGMAIPTSSVKPVATWVNEGAGSDKQKKTTAGTITFTHYKLRCEIAMTMETSVMAISAFETAFVRQVSEAMVKAVEDAIINGAKDASDNLIGPKGILDETAATGQALEADELNYQLLIDAEAAIPQAYEGGVKWCMTKKTFMAFAGMVDTAGQPIARVNYGIGGKPERTLLGREVVLCGDYMDSFSPTLEAGKIFAFLFNFSDYTLNTNYNMGIQRKQDWDTEDLLTKAVMAVDGKVVDKNSLVTIAIPASEG
jgi:HK97 family phage major capsid protein